VGNNEKENGTVSIRIRGKGDIGTVELEKFIQSLAAERDSKSLESSVEARNAPRKGEGKN